GYSPDFFAQLKAQRIAILTYHKFPGQKWPAAEFTPQPVRLHDGQIVELELAERGTRLSNGLWVRKVRQLSASGSQSSVLSTDMRLDLTRIAAGIAARWSQENFLKYMREHYGLDRLIEYGTQPLPETLVVVIPPGAAWIKACAVSVHGCFGFKPTSVPAPCPSNPVPSRSRTSSARAASYETKSKFKSSRSAT